MHGSFVAGGGMRMLGQQLSQVAQQGAVTGNYLGALAVQLPDMALGFGGVAIAASIVATVAVPLIIGAFGGGASAAEAMTDANGRLGNSISALRAIGDTSLEDLREKYGEVDAELLQLIEHQRQFQLDQAATAARDAVKALADEYGFAASTMEQYRITGRGDAAAIAAELGLSKDAMLGFLAAIREAKSATTFEEQAAALSKIDDYLQRSTISGSDLAGEVNTAALALREVEAAANGTAEGIGAGKGEAKGLAEQLQTTGVWALEAANHVDGLDTNLSSAVGSARGVADWAQMANANIAAAANQAGRLAGNLLEAMSIQNRVSAQQNSGGRGDGMAELRYRQTGVNPEAGQFVYDGPSLDAFNNPRSTVTSGGGAGSGPASGSLDALQAEGRRALEAMGFAVAGINEKVQAGLMSTAEGVDAVASAKDRAANALADLIPKIEALGGPKALAATGNLRSALKDLVGEIGKAGSGLGATMTKGFEGAFASFLSGAKSGKEAFRDFSQSVLNDIARIVSQRFTNRFVAPLIDGVLGLFGLARGGVVQQGVVQAFAEGGVPALSAHRNSVVSTPTLFALGGGATGLMGEAGPEAVMPLRQGPGGLSVVASGPGGETLLPLQRSLSGALGVRMPAGSAHGRSPVMDRPPVAFAVGGIVGGSTFRLGEQADGYPSLT